MKSFLKDKLDHVTSLLKTQTWFPSRFTLKSKFLTLAQTTFHSSLTIPPFPYPLQPKLFIPKDAKLPFAGTFALAFFPPPRGLVLNFPVTKPHTGQRLKQQSYILTHTHTSISKYTPQIDHIFSQEQNLRHCNQEFHNK